MVDSSSCHCSRYSAKKEHGLGMWKCHGMFDLWYSYILLHTVVKERLDKEKIEKLTWLLKSACMHATALSTEIYNT